jgi:hypothetical protein
MSSITKSSPMTASRSSCTRFKSLTVMSLLCAAVAAVTPAHAQWMVHDDGLSLTQQAQHGDSILHMVTQYTQMITQYQSLLSSLQSLDLNFTPTNNQLTPIDNPSQIVAQNCPGASLSSTVVSMLGMSPTLTEGEIVGQQRTICASIVLLQIDKYNTVAAMLNRMNTYSTAIKQMSDKINTLGQGMSSVLSSVTGTSGSSGDRQAVQNQADQLQNTLATDMAGVQQHLQAVDATISALKDQQSMLANIALKGSNATGPAALAGQIVQAGAFAAAFPQ